MRRVSGDNKKAPAKGLKSHTLSLEECEPAAAWAGVLTYGFAADYSGGTVADFHGLPPTPRLARCRQWVYAARRGVSTVSLRGLFASAVPGRRRSWISESTRFCGNL